MNLFKSNFLSFLPNIYNEKSEYFLFIYFSIFSLFHHFNQTEAIGDNHTWKTKKIDRLHCTTSSTAKLKYISITYPLRRQKKKFKLSKSTNSHSQFHSTHYELVNGGWHEAPEREQNSHDERFTPPLHEINWGTRSNQAQKFYYSQIWPTHHSQSQRSVPDTLSKTRGGQHTPTSILKV